MFFNLQQNVGVVDISLLGLEAGQRLNMVFFFNAARYFSGLHRYFLYIFEVDHRGHQFAPFFEERFIEGEDLGVGSLFLEGEKCEMVVED